MADYVEVATTDELAAGTMMKVIVGGSEVLLARDVERYYAAENRCPHMGGDLSKGTLKGTIVTCPQHHSKFNLVDGRVVRWTDWKGVKLSLAKVVKSPRPLTTYEVKVEEGKILVGTVGRKIEVAAAR